ncbi:MAG: hypothetical protein K2I14_09130 [Eubacterium sp.]|nr:hypothetical protein [Eubacterium sp.]
MKKSVKAAFCGMAAALSVALMFAGSLFYVFAYAIPMLLGIIVFMIHKTFGRSYAFYVYLAASILSMLFVPDKETALMYALFFGYYPIVKHYIERIKIKALSLLLKLLLFNLSVFVIEILCVKLFNIPFFDDGVFSKSMLIFFAVAMNLCFVMYEGFLKNYKIIYERKIEPRILKALK